MNKSILALAVLASTNAIAAPSLFEVESNIAPFTVSKATKNHTVLSAAQITLTVETTAIKLPLNGELVKFTKKTASVSSSGNLVWHGITASGDQATLVQSQIGITGTIHLENQLFKLSPSFQEGHNLIEIDEAAMPREHSEEYAPEQPAAMLSLSNLVIDDTVTQMSTPAEIKLLVVYTAAAKARVADINSLIDLSISETNTGYQNSGVNASVSLVHKAQVNYTEASNSSTDLSRLAGTNDGYMDEVHGLRDQYGADVVVLVNDVNGYCGQADAIGANAQSAFAMVDWDCATGYYSFGHEIGHLQGARHNPENDPSTTPYAFGHGYQDPQSRWRTVMAYNCSSGCTRINYWSNPNKTYNGDVMGTTSDNDNARVLNLTSPTIANFRNGTVTPPTGNELEQNVSQTISDSRGGQKFFTFTVPQGASDISVAISGGSGDADLYVKAGSSVGTNNYDCRPYKNGNSESCPLTQAGEYAVMVSAYSAYSNVNIVGSYTVGGTGGLPIVQNHNNLSGAQGSWQYFTVDAPSNASSVSVTMAGGTGDADLYVRKGAQPTTSSYDCRPWKNGNSESCTQSVSSADTWHVGVRGYSAFSGVNLEIRVD